MENTKTKPYCVQAEVYWRDSNNGLQLAHTTKIYHGKDKDTVYEYITYDAGHNGYVDVKIIHEGEPNT